MTMPKCISQIRLKKADGTLYDVPCGRCGNCLQNRRKEWSFRLQKELRAHLSAFFLTLTYHDLSLPWADDEQGNTYPVLQKADFQKFMKRLRKKHNQLFPGVKLKYYAVGEYGSKTLRPHYHAIIFSMRREIIPFLSDIWPLGFIHTGQVTNDSIDYVTKYVVNKYDHKHFLVPPFSLISNGIGLEHYKKNSKLYQNADKVTGARGYPQVIPRYYRDKQIKSPFTKEILAKKSKIKGEILERRELERLEKLHPDPLSYIREREVASSDRILRTSKDRQKL